MKKITSISQIMTAIDSKWDFCQDINGKIHKLSFVTVLQTKLIDLIQMIKDEVLYYSPEC